MKKTPAVEKAATTKAAKGNRKPKSPSGKGSGARSRTGIRVRFLGSGASGWDPEMAKANPDFRRQSSVLLENKVLIDFTPCSFDKLPRGCRPKALFQTHSHDDHYNAEAAVKSGVERMYVHETWFGVARREVAAAAKALRRRAPDVIPFQFGKAIEECGLKLTAVPANHSTSRVTDGVLERTALFLVEKGRSRLLYATDTGGIPGDAARMIGIDPHIRPENIDRLRLKAAPFLHDPEPLTAIVFEATDGDLDDDFRMFVHSSVQLVERTVRMLMAHGRYTPPPGQKAYLTHFGLKYRDWPSARIEKELPDCLAAACDGLEVTLG